jgi:hypothetical protein
MPRWRLEAEVGPRVRRARVQRDGRQTEPRAGVEDGLVREVEHHLAPFGGEKRPEGGRPGLALGHPLEARDAVRLGARQAAELLRAAQEQRRPDLVRRPERRQRLGHDRWVVLAVDERDRPWPARRHRSPRPSPGE